MVKVGNMGELRNAARVFENNPKYRKHPGDMVATGAALFVNDPLAFTSKACVVLRANRPVRSRWELRGPYVSLVCLAIICGVLKARGFL